MKSSAKKGTAKRSSSKRELIDTGKNKMFANGTGGEALRGSSGKRLAIRRLSAYVVTPAGPLAVYTTHIPPPNRFV